MYNEMFVEILFENKKNATLLVQVFLILTKKNLTRSSTCSYVLYSCRQNYATKIDSHNVAQNAGRYVLIYQETYKTVS